MITMDSKILVVDDLMLGRTIVVDTLKDMGFQNVEEATDGDDALAKLIKASEEEQEFNVVFSDRNMPNKNGLELLSSVRNHEKLKNLVFIMVTGEGEQQYVDEAMAAGATDYIVKPISKMNLKEKVESINIAA